MNSFHNTIETNGQQLIQFEDESKSLEENIYNLFKRHPTWSLAWFETAYYLPKNTHEGSIKRAVTNLKTQELIIKTEDKVLSPYGKPAHRYKLK